MVSAAALGLGLLLAQAEPAPVPQAAPPPLLNALGVFGRLGFKVGDEARLGPAAGFSVGVSFARRYAHVGAAPGPGPGPEPWSGMDLAVGLDLFHDQFTSSVQGSVETNPGVEATYEGRRLLTQTSFAATHTFSLPLSRMRLWAAAGAGLTIAHFSSPEPDLRPGDRSAVQPLVRGAVGFDVIIKSEMGIAVRGDYTHLLTRPSFTTDTGQTLSLFGDLLDIGVGLFYRF